MKTTEQTRADERPLSHDILYTVRYYLGGRSGLLILIGILVVASLGLNWSWLVAIGVAPLLLALAPCAVMCALGLCAARMTGRSCASQSDVDQPELPARTMARTQSGGSPAAAPSRKATRRKAVRGKSPGAGKSQVKAKAAEPRANSGAGTSSDAKAVPIMTPVSMRDSDAGRVTETETVQVDDADSGARRGKSVTGANPGSVALTSRETSRERS